ncbi:helix-turn-helix transcriptional regulator [Candidatus Bandiella euplotis]|uniref:Helix-turn-helix transcriptional regulator n=1 Tax=Candidatus Bandiella euplotis TaxID=1664265 RepID=A0ABZ0ULU6_9RICK|nr:helix-turn-helix transcriptional regulator [Candidatus Bandiella woodruffii]WPX96018.1 Putative helix-turn-helix transcriptional regulator [Candidatus Bandiella woodruffii]
MSISRSDQVLISSAQVRAARGLLNWTQSELADRCNLTKATIANIENEKHHLTSKTADKIYQAFTEANIEFLGNDGLRSKVEVIKVFEGKNGVHMLLDEVYESVKENGGCVKVSGIDENLLQETLDKDYIAMHINRMQRVKNLTFQVLISNRDFNPYARKYVEYRAVPSEYFFPLPIYIYDRKVAAIIFNPIRVILIENFHLFLAHSNQFEMVWEMISGECK